ncbi:hypothetical protein ACXDF8_11525 [Mycolicibacterium sp. CBM1]
MTGADPVRDPKLLQFIHGKNNTLEAAANEWLAKDVGENTRSIDRDIEKVQYESGQILRDELRLYDPRNDWDTQDSAYSILIDPGDMAYVTPSLCDGHDGNVRARDREDPNTPPGTWGAVGIRERQKMTRHVGDEDDWGATYEDIPPLGQNTRDPTLGKRCTRCNLIKLNKYFGPEKRNSDGMRSWCKQCDRESAKAAYARKSK